MDFGLLTDFIANNGFPIVMCGVLIYKEMKTSQNTTEQLNELTISTKEMQMYVKQSIDKISDTVSVLEKIVDKFIGEENE